MVTLMQIRRARQNYVRYPPLEVCLLDEISESGEVTTILKYDEQNVIFQQLTCKGVLKYKILQNDEFMRLNKSVELPIA